MLYENFIAVLQQISDPDGVDNCPSMNNDLGYSLDGLRFRPLPDFG
jgi:hypothetical protein